MFDAFHLYFLFYIQWNLFWHITETEYSVAMAFYIYRNVADVFDDGLNYAEALKLPPPLQNENISWEFLFICKQ